MVVSRPGLAHEVASTAPAVEPRPERVTAAERPVNHSYADAVATRRAAEVELRRAEMQWFRS